MHIYRLRAGIRDGRGFVQKITIDDEIYAANDNEAIRLAKMYQVSRFLEVSDYAWLTDVTERLVWRLVLEEAA